MRRPDAWWSAAARRHRRAAVSRRRLLETATGWLLAVLVAASVGLGAVFWSGALWSASPITDQDPVLAGVRYVGPDDTQSTAGDLVTPQRILLLYPGGRGDLALSPPTGASGADFLPVWADLQHALVGAQPVAGSAGSSGLKTLTQRLADYFAAPADSGGAAVEADFGPLIGWSEWLQAFGGRVTQPPAADDPRMERLVLLPEHPGACGSTPAWVYLVAGTSVRALLLPAEKYAPVCNRVAGLRNQFERAGYAVVPLATLAGDLSPKAQLAVAGASGLLVPPPDPQVLWWWQPGTFRTEALDPEQAKQFAMSLLPDAPWRNRDGTLFTTAGGDTLQLDPATGGASAFFRRGGSRAVPGWFQALDAAVALVNRSGGWPPTAWLAGAQGTYAEGGCTLASCPDEPQTIAFTFSIRYQGLPVLPLAGAPPALLIEMSGTPVLPVRYSRMVPLPALGSPAPRGDRSEQHAPAPPPVGAAQAIDVAIHNPPPELVGDNGETLQVTEVLPTYVALMSAHTLEPAWAVELAPTNGGAPAVLLVDAMNANVLGVWHPN